VRKEQTGKAAKSQVREKPNVELCGVLKQVMDNDGVYKRIDVGDTMDKRKYIWALWWCFSKLFKE
jgi:hypothetical protein